MSRAGRLATIALILALGTSTAVMAADDGETIKACADKKTGALRIVKDKKDCRKTEQFLRWNERGPRGPQGPEGPRGPRGSSGGGGGGPAGPPGPDLGNYISASLRNCPIVVSPGQAIPFSSIDVANGIAISGPTTFQLSTSGVYRITYNTGAVTSTPTQGQLAIERNDLVLAASAAATGSGLLVQEFLATFTAGDTIRLVSTATDPFTLNGSVCATVTMQLIDPA